VASTLVGVLYKTYIRVKKLDEKQRLGNFSKLWQENIKMILIRRIFRDLGSFGILRIAEWFVKRSSEYKPHHWTLTTQTEPDLIN
jgi:hypothetical protein